MAAVAACVLGCITLPRKENAIVTAIVVCGIAWVAAVQLEYYDALKVAISFTFIAGFISIGRYLTFQDEQQSIQRVLLIVFSCY